MGGLKPKNPMLLLAVQLMLYPLLTDHNKTFGGKMKDIYAGWDEEEDGEEDEESDDDWQYLTITFIFLYRKLYKCYFVEF